MHLPRRPRLAPLACALALAARAAGADAPPANPDPATLPIRPDITVAADGSGNFTNVQDALNSLPRNNRERRVIYIKDGTYLQKLRIDPPFITLRGQSRAGTRIVFAQSAEAFRRRPDALGVGVVNLNGDDCVVQNLTIQNTHGVIGAHAIAISDRADRTVITDCDVFSQGNDTLALSRPDGGRYYLARLNVRGSADFVCPRGSCYMGDCSLFEVDPRAEAALWHDGSKNRDMKFVLQRCRLDGVPGWRLARHHYDAQFYLLDCEFSERMRDLAPRRVIYPLGSRAPTQEETHRNVELQAANVWGERSYFSGCHRTGGDYGWFADNLATAPGAPPPERITAAWTFGGTWDPERTDSPVIRQVAWRNGRLQITFSEPVTVKGRPQVVLTSGATAAYVSGSGGDTLEFDPPTSPTETAVGFDLGGGAIVASQAAASPRAANLTLP